MKKIEHDYKCNICGKPAEYNFQTINKWWTIDKKGDFKDYDGDCGDVNEFYCEKCYNKEFN
jgi:hypothetical protein